MRSFRMRIFILIVLVILALIIIFGDPIILDKLFSNLDDIYKILELICLVWFGRIGWNRFSKKECDNDKD